MASGVQQKEKPRLQLEASLPDWCAVDWRQTLVCAAFVLAFMWFSYLPIPTSTTWHNVLQGRSVAETFFGSTLTDTTKVPLTEGLRSFRGAAVGSWIIWQIQNLGGSETLSLSFAVLQILIAAALAFLFYRTTGRWWTALIAPLVLVMPWQISGLSTACFGQLCIAATLLCLTWRTRSVSVSTFSKTQWIVAAFTFMLWVNLDHSFVAGWILLACLVIARIISCLSSTVERKNIFSDGELRSRIVLFEIAIAVSLINPQGWNLWQSMFWAPDNPIWLNYGGSQPLAIVGWVGASVIALAIFWLACSRRTSAIQTIHWLLPLVALAIVCCNRFTLAVFAPLILWSSISMLPRKEIAPREKNPQEDIQPLKFSLLLACALLIWLGFAFSPFSHHLLGGQARTESQLRGKSSPHTALAYLDSKTKNAKARPLVWTPRTWSNRCILSCDNVSVFVADMPHLTPQQTNKDHDTIFHGHHGWQKLLGRYTVDFLVVDVKKQQRLTRELRSSPGNWVRLYEDPVASVWSIHKPKKKKQSTAEPKAVASKRRTVK